MQVSLNLLDFLEGACIEELPRPSRSPDIYLIENVWGLISSRVYDCPQPTNLDDLCQKIVETVNYYNLHFKNYSKALSTSLIKSFLSVVTKTGIYKTVIISCFSEVYVRCSKQFRSFCAYCLLIACFKVR